MEESFPHYYEDGYLITNLATSGWPIVWYAGVYRNGNTFPYQWNTLCKRAKPVAQFVGSIWRGKEIDKKKAWFGCGLTYNYSAN